MGKFRACKYLEMKENQVWEQLLVSSMIPFNTFPQGQKKEGILLANMNKSSILKYHPPTCAPNFIDLFYES